MLETKLGLQFDLKLGLELVNRLDFNLEQCWYLLLASGDVNHGSQTSDLNTGIIPGLEPTQVSGSGH